MFRKLRLKSVKQMSGSHKYPAIHKSLLRVGTNQIENKLTNSRLCPINRAPKGQSLYDTIAFLILCAKHRKIAVCNTYHLNHEIAVWLPFIYLSKNVRVKDGIIDGLCLILSDYESKILLKYKEEIPFVSKIISTIEVYFPKTNRKVHRINCLAILNNNTSGFECCGHTSRIHWLDVEEVCKSSGDQFWGPQVRNLSVKLRDYPESFKSFQIFTKAPILYLANDYYENYNLVYCEDYMLYSLGIKRNQIELLFNDFYEHCFPSLVMTFHSFADYLCKYGFQEINRKMRRLFNAFKYPPTPHYSTTKISFSQMLLGMACIDKDSPHDRTRLLFVFKYYGQNRDGILSEVEFREMVTDIHKNEGQEEIDRIVADGMNGNESPKGMNWDEFYDRAERHEFGDATLLGKSDVSLIRNILEDIKAKTTQPMDTLINLFRKHKQ